MSDIEDIHISFGDENQQLQNSNNNNHSHNNNHHQSHHNNIFGENGELKYDDVRVDAYGCTFEGKRFGISYKDLELMEVVGRGQLGLVRKARNKNTNDVVAVKQVRLPTNESSIKSTFIELKVLTQSFCPNIVSFFGAFFVDGHLYYCMEYMDYGSIDRLYEGGVPEAAVAKITESTLMGLSFLKDQLKVIHRDVRPSNILINSKGHVKLCDFNVAGKLVESLANSMTGCQKYMPPERITASKTNPYSVHSDVWSLGLSIIEISTGEFPFSQLNIYAQLKKIVEEEPPQLPDRFSDEIRDFVSRCLKKKSSDRWNFHQLLSHPFIKNNSKYDLVEWISTRPPPTALSPVKS